VEISLQINNDDQLSLLHPSFSRQTAIHSFILIPTKGYIIQNVAAIKIKPIFPPRLRICDWKDAYLRCYRVWVAVVCCVCVAFLSSARSPRCLRPFISRIRLDAPITFLSPLIFFVARKICHISFPVRVSVKNLWAHYLLSLLITPFVCCVFAQRSPRPSGCHAKLPQLINGANWTAHAIPQGPLDEGDFMAQYSDTQNVNQKVKKMKKFLLRSFQFYYEFNIN